MAEFVILSPEEELWDIYNPRPGTVRRGREAMEFYEYHRLFNGVLPKAGGYEDQSAEWVEAMRCVLTAKEWSEALQRAHHELMSAMSGDPEHVDQERVNEAREHFMTLEESHDEKVEAMRSYWRGEG